MAEGTEAVAPEVRAAIAEIAAGMDVAGLGERIGAVAIQTVQDLAARDDADLDRETALAATSNVEAILRGLTAGTPPEQAKAPEASVAWVSTLVHRGVGAAVIPRCYVVGQALMDLAMREAVWEQDLSPEAKWELAGSASQYLFGYVQAVSAELVDHYESERDRWVRGADSIRTELVLEMVEGRPFDVTAAGATLRYDLSRPHIALLVWSDPSHSETATPAALKTAAAALMRELGGTELLVIPAGTTVAWAWTTGPNLTDVPAAALAVDPTLQASVGAVGHGPKGLIRSHREAREARRMAGVLARRPGSVVRYQSVALSSLMTHDLPAAADFVERELGELGDDTDTSRRLRATLIAYFEEGMSWGKTAKRLGIHQNTVVYRARQAEELLGRPLTERRLELEAALRLADVRGNLRS